MNKYLTLVATTLAIVTFGCARGNGTPAVQTSLDSSSTAAWPAPGFAVDANPQSAPSAALGTVTVASDLQEPLAGNEFRVSYRVEPREAAADGRLVVTLGPGLELLAGGTEEAIALVPGQPIVRELRVKKTQDADTSIVVTAKGASARRGGAWSFSSHANFRIPKTLRPATPTFVDGTGQPLVGDR